jgi:hypothetical protein
MPSVMLLGAFATPEASQTSRHASFCTARRAARLDDRWMSVADTSGDDPRARPLVRARREENAANCARAARSKRTA